MGESISISQEKKNVPLHERLIPSRSEENFAVNHLDDLKKIVSEESLDVLDWHQTVLLVCLFFKDSSSSQANEGSQYSPNSPERQHASSYQELDEK